MRSNENWPAQNLHTAVRACVIGESPAEGKTVCGCAENTQPTSQVIWSHSFLSCKSRKMPGHSAHRYQMTWSFLPSHIIELLCMASCFNSPGNYFKNTRSHKNKCMSQMTWTTLSHSLSDSLSFPLTGSVWWWCQCLDSAAAYLHQSSQLDREEKDFPAQLCQWVSEIYPHKTLLDWKEAWGKLGSV